MCVNIDFIYVLTMWEKNFSFAKLKSFLITKTENKKKKIKDCKFDSRTMEDVLQYKIEK